MGIEQYMNPKIDGSQNNLATLINNLPRKSSQTLTVSGTKQIPSTWWNFYEHFQGIAPYNNTTAIGNGFIGASADPGFFLGFAASGTNTAVVKTVNEPNSSYNHPGGMQMLGNFLPVPLEGKNVGAIINCYDAASPTNAAYQYTVIPGGNKASAVGVTNYTTVDGFECALMCVWFYDHFEMLWLQCHLNQMMTNNTVWQQVGMTKGAKLNTGDQFQSFALVTQRNPGGGTTPPSDQVYLCGFREDEELHLYTVNTFPGADCELTWLETFTGWSGADWRNAAGLQIVSPTQIRIYGSPMDPSGTTTNYSFELPIWGS